MATDPNVAPIQLTSKDETYLEPSLERAYGRGEINLTEARLYSGYQAVSHEVVARPASLEEVTKGYVPPTSVKAPAKLRTPPKPRTAYQRMVADRRSIPETQRVPERDESRRLRSIDGGQADRR